MLKAIRPLTLTVLLVLSPKLFANGLTPDDEFSAWNDVEVPTVQLVMRDSEDHKCEISPTNLLGCAMALNSIGEFLNPRVEVVSLRSLSRRPQIDDAAILHRLGDLALVRWSYDPITHISSDRETYEAWAQRHQELKDAISSVPLDSASRDTLIAWADEILSQIQDRPIKKVYAAGITALVAVRDGHFSLESRKEYEEQYSGHENFTGIGIEIRRDEDSFYIVRVVADGPADQAGLKVGDRILAVDTTRTGGLPLDAITRLVRGPAGTRVRLEVERAGQQMAFEIERRAVRSNDFDSAVLSSGSKRLLKLSLRSFYENACREMKVAISLNRAVDGILIDLRGNPGGLVKEVSCMIGLFVGPTKVFSERPVLPLDPINETLKVSKTNTATYETKEKRITRKPVVVLVDHTSASASEIFAGSMIEHKRGWVLGERTWGKGSVQTVEEVLTNLIQIQTTGLYFFPSGWSPQLNGVQPDIEVFPKRNQTVEDPDIVREREVVPTALAVPTAPSQPRRSPDRIERMRSCLSRGEAPQSDAFDHQLVVAQDTLKCLIMPQQASFVLP